MHTKKQIFLVIGIVAGVLLLSITLGYAQEAGERLTQEEFAVELVQSMHMDGWLPIAALPSDCVDLLERLGVAPLTGWNNKAYLSQEDYYVVMGQINGKENLVYERAIAVEEKNVEIINKKWQQSYDTLGRWVPLSQLMNDRAYFPDGPSESPFGLEYLDRDNDHKVDPHFLPVIGLMKFRKVITSQDF